ncbi:MAG: hypothetical protein QOG35_1411, partial [Solirubrobacteraceae bacterium]|nr:hypothetical protein [Solirubrobacteraceae bacterium]
MSVSHPDAATVDGALRVGSAPARARTRRPGGLDAGRVRSLVAADLLAIGLALAGTYGLAELVAPPAALAPSAIVVVGAVLAAASWIVIFAAYRLYEGQSSSIAPASLDEVGHLFHALLAGSLLLLVAGQGL